MIRALAISCLLLAGCTRVDSGAATSTAERQAVAASVTKFTDEEKGVICYVYSGYKAGGISCLPLRSLNQ